jgi:hypothetical protein
MESFQYYRDTLLIGANPLHVSWDPLAVYIVGEKVCASGADRTYHMHRIWKLVSRHTPQVRRLNQQITTDRNQFDEPTPHDQVKIYPPLNM